MGDGFSGNDRIGRNSVSGRRLVKQFGALPAESRICVFAAARPCSNEIIDAQQGGAFMSTLPLGARPSVTWHPNPTNTHFGAPRGGGVPGHGACDFVAPAGTKGLAVANEPVLPAAL